MILRVRRSPETIFKHVFLVVAFLGIISFIKSSHETSSNLQRLRVGRSLRTVAENEACRFVHTQPDQCAFVRANCPDEEAGLLSYLQFYYCTLQSAKPVAFILLTIWISTLFSTIGIAASDFLCLNLSTISNVMGMSENLAGVTFLAFGNGSPDMFATFAAFNSNSGSLAIGELMGAASFITAVVAGSMAITKPFRVAKKAFIRDVSLFAIAAAFSLTFLRGGSLHMWECIVMICFYAAYVVLVVVWHWYFEWRRKKRVAEAAARSHHHIPDQQELDVPEEEDDEESRPAAERDPLLRTQSGASANLSFGPGTPAWAEENVDEVDDETRDQYYAALSSNMRVSRPTRGRRNTINPIRPSLIGALEFRSVLSALEKKSTNVQPIYMRRYSDDRRNSYQGPNESQNRASHSQVPLDNAGPPDTKLGSPSQSGRSRAVSTGDIDMMRASTPSPVNISGSPVTTVFSSNFPPQLIVGNDIPPENTLNHNRAHVSTSHPTRPLPSPGSVSSAAMLSEEPTPASLTATRNGLLAPPEPDFLSVDFAAHHSRTGPGASSSAVISPLALTPKIHIPSSDQTIAHDSRYTDSPLPISSNTSRAPSVHLPPPSMSPDSSHLFGLAEDSSPLQRHFKWWPYRYLPAPQVLFSTLLPGLHDWSEKSWPDKVLALFTAPSIFLLTVTVPVVEAKSDEDEDYDEPPLDGTAAGSPVRSRAATLVLTSPVLLARPYNNAQVPHMDSPEPRDPVNSSPKDWNRWLVILQVFTAPLAIVLIIWANLEGDEDGNKSRMLLLKLVMGSLVLSLIGLAGLLTLTDATHEPKHQPISCFMGFIVAVAWISTIAGEVVGVLKTFGVILNISDAILGLTIFAVGNSLGDLVADITVARLGFPMMALSACFGGPMLNILLGIGLGGLYQTVLNAKKRARTDPDNPIRDIPYRLEINTTLLVSGAALVMTLIFLLIVVPLNKWRMDRKVGVSLIALWAASTTLNVVLEIIGAGETE